jgi:transposase-like protein
MGFPENSKINVKSDSLRYDKKYIQDIGEEDEVMVIGEIKEGVCNYYDEYVFMRLSFVHKNYVKENEIYFKQYFSCSSCQFQFNKLEVEVGTKVYGINSEIKYIIVVNGLICSEELVVYNNINYMNIIIMLDRNNDIGYVLEFNSKMKNGVKDNNFEEFDIKENELDIKRNNVDMRIGIENIMKGDIFLDNIVYELEKNKKGYRIIIGTPIITDEKKIYESHMNYKSDEELDLYYGKIVKTMKFCKDNNDSEEKIKKLLIENYKKQHIKTKDEILEIIKRNKSIICYSKNKYISYDGKISDCDEFYSIRNNINH